MPFITMFPVSRSTNATSPKPERTMNSSPEAGAGLEFCCKIPLKITFPFSANKAAFEAPYLNMNLPGSGQAPQSWLHEEHDSPPSHDKSPQFVSSISSGEVQPASSKSSKPSSSLS